MGLTKILESRRFQAITSIIVVTLIAVSSYYSIKLNRQILKERGEL